MFEGFSPESIDFLWGIRFNNRRDWFQAHKKEYEDHLYKPMQALAQEVREKYQLHGTILKTARIYRDVRYSDVPYKEHLWFCIRQDNQFWSEHPSLYFQIEPEGGSCGFIFYAPKARVMELHRKKLLENPRPFLDIVEPLMADPALSERSIRYKRPKPGCTGALEPWYQLKNCFFEEQIPVGDDLFSPQLADHLVSRFRTLEPIYHYFKKLESELAE